MLNLLPLYFPALASSCSPQLSPAVPPQLSRKPHYASEVTRSANNLQFSHPSRAVLLAPQQHQQESHTDAPPSEGPTCRSTRGELPTWFVWGLDWLEHHWFYFAQVPFFNLQWFGVFFIFFQGFWFFGCWAFLEKKKNQTNRPSGVETWVHSTNPIFSCAVLHCWNCQGPLFSFPLLHSETIHSQHNPSHFHFCFIILRYDTKCL